VNTSDAPALREFWLNLYYPPRAPVQEVRQVRASGGTSWTIEPGANRWYRFDCPIESSGRLLSLGGRFLPTTRRLNAWLRRANGERLDILSQDEDSVSNAVREFHHYSSLGDAYTDPLLDPDRNDPERSPHSGILEIDAGDVLEWECHVVNDWPTPLTYVDDIMHGAVCDLRGEVIGVDINCVLP
jgi:hypothetical protein